MAKHRAPDGESTSMKPCPVCNGTGIVFVETRPGLKVSRKCSACAGKRVIPA